MSKQCWEWVLLIAETAKNLLKFGGGYLKKIRRSVDRLIALSYAIIFLSVAFFATAAMADNIDDRIRAAISDLRLRNVESGHVFRPPMYWSKFNYHRSIEPIFSGRFDKAGSSRIFYGRLLRAYAVQYSRQCSDFIPSDATVIERSLRVTQRYRTGRFRQYDIHVESIALKHSLEEAFLEGFADKTQAFVSDKQQAMGLFFDEMKNPGGGNLSVAREVFGNFFLDMAAFLDLEGCSSPAQYQLEENLLRYWLQAPSLQDDGIPVWGAERATPTLDEALTPADVTMACAHHAKYDYSEYKYCRCLDDRSFDYLSTQKYAELVGNFNRMSPLLSQAKNRCDY